MKPMLFLQMTSYSLYVAKLENLVRLHDCFELNKSEQRKSLPSSYLNAHCLSNLKKWENFNTDGNVSR